MLNAETKKKINSLRQILVGKVPDPKSQVEQITNALIYKYMDDMDQQSIAYGGEAGFFVGDYEKYTWRNLMDPKIGGQERMNIYVEALESFGTNPNLPPLFRDILKDAYLPFKDPNTLNLFLKEVDWFSYDHSEDLGDAFEYLLSIMGSQGDAGQFRTPRHIIDFIVKLVDPQLHEKVLDPACGTAGFLISAYKHILEENSEKKPGDKLSVDQRKTLLKNFVGYDISPEMVKLSRVNMFLHGFQDPHIFEYDTLSSDTRWNDAFDIILANPPFMSPKGGIVPHSKFSIKSSRAEVLFVDYIIEHLKPKGRAGIVVPEGIIFQTGNAYKQLRKSLLEAGLSAVISLPVGVFNPYTKTTKTSILIIDKHEQLRSGGVRFVKLENDGFDLGSERFPIERNDIPAILAIFQKHKQAEHPKETDSQSDIVTQFISVDDILGRPSLNFAVLHDLEAYNHSKYSGIKIGNILQQIKRKITLKDGERYSQVTVKMHGKGVVLRKVIKGADVKTKNQFEVRSGDFIMSKIDARHGAFGIVPKSLDRAVVTSDFPVFSVNTESMRPEFLRLVAKSPAFLDICQTTSVGTSNRKRIKLKKFLDAQIPLPSLDEQDEILKKLSSLEQERNEYSSRVTELNRQISEEINNIW